MNSYNKVLKYIRRNYWISGNIICNLSLYSTLTDIHLYSCQINLYSVNCYIPVIYIHYVHFSNNFIQ